MTSKELRQKYLDYFKDKGHVVVSSASLVPENDPSTLFVGSGMQPMVPYLLGEKHPKGTRICNSQKSFRQGDIEEVGDNRHNTFFEMLGNWSLGDYFKREQISWIFDFIINELKVDPERFYVSVYRGNKDIGIGKDEEVVALWRELFKEVGVVANDVDMAERDGMKKGDRIFYYNDKENWWSRSGVPENMPVGEPGGPDSEMFYDLGKDLKRHENSQWKDNPCHPACDCGRFIEIGNSVFMEYIKTENGFEKLPQKNVDFGGGLERMTMVVQGKDNVFETDLFSNILEKISELSGGKKYRENMKEFEVIADHIKAATMIMGDDRGVAPSNTDQGYVVRRLLRRAIRYGMQLGITQDSWTKDIAEIVIEDYKDIYEELDKNSGFILNCLIEEESKFSKTLENGLKELLRLTVGRSENKKDSFEVTGKELFYVFSTYGFPLEMSLEELGNNIKKLYVDNNRNIIDTPLGKKLIDEFNKESKKHQELSRSLSGDKFKGGLADSSDATKKLHTATHLLHSALRKVLGDHVEQKGSNITAERLRFDFTHPDKMTPEQIQEVEGLVNGEIQKSSQVMCHNEISVEEAKDKGAIGLFESQYGEKVKMYEIGDFSREICGGPHVDNLGELGKFKIKKEQSSSSGVRRIKAILT